MTSQQYFVIPAKERVKKSKRPTDTSSFPRKRESRGAARKTIRRLCCGIARLDSRFRGNDEVLIEFYRLLSRQFFDVPTVVARAARFLHALESGNLVWRFRNITVGESCMRRL